MLPRIRGTCGFAGTSVEVQVVPVEIRTQSGGPGAGQRERFEFLKDQMNHKHDGLMVHIPYSLKVWVSVRD